MSSRLAYFDSNMDTAWLRYPKSSAFAMNPARSPMTTGSLPSERANSAASSTTSCDVTTVRTTSTKACTGAGLKKWMPTTLAGRLVATAMSVTDSEDVLLARIACGGAMASTLPKISFLRSRLSLTASITRSASDRAG